MIKKYTVVLTVLSAALILFGCSDRGTNIVDSTFVPRMGNQAAIVNVGGHLMADDLGLSMFTGVSKFPAIPFSIYTPYNDTLPMHGQGKRYPVLYLLAPFGASNNFYFDHGLATIADEMIYKGEINPMIIVCFAASDGYGGTFYGNTWAGGKYAKAMGDREGDPVSGSMIDYIEYRLNVDTMRVNRGISGFGMGGYGAMRIAVEYSENFGSVSAVAAPLDFDGAGGTGGFVPLFKEVVRDIDPSGHIPYDEYKELDTSYNATLRTMIMAAACSFSPHVLNYKSVTGSPPVGHDPEYLNDTMSYFNPEARIEFHLPFDQNGNIPDTNVIDTTIKVLLYGYDTTTWEVDTLTFDTTIVIDTTILLADTLIDTVGLYDSVWTLWLNNNVESLLRKRPDALDATEIRLFNLTGHEFGFVEQTANFANFLEGHLRARGIVKDLKPIYFSGYFGYPAISSSRFVYDILPSILKFHSSVFNVPQ
jgi:hypothetical protein